MLEFGKRRHAYTDRILDNTELAALRRDITFFSHRIMLGGQRILQSMKEGLFEIRDQSSDILTNNYMFVHKSDEYLATIIVKEQHLTHHVTEVYVNIVYNDRDPNLQRYDESYSLTSRGRLYGDTNHQNTGINLPRLRVSDQQKLLRLELMHHVISQFLASGTPDDAGEQTF